MSQRDIWWVAKPDFDDLRSFQRNDWCLNFEMLILHSSIFNCHKHFFTKLNVYKHLEIRQISRFGKMIKMSNTYTQLHVQLIFAVKFRLALIDKKWKSRLHKYMSGVFQNDGHKLLQINSMPDHLHLFGGFRPSYSISSICQHLKSESTKWINSEGLCEGRFEWQEGYGAFSYSKSQVDSVIRYIMNQEAHHKKETFLDEYRRFLRSFEIEYDEKYIFKEPI